MTHQHHCYKCGRELKQNQIVWLELNNETGEFIPASSDPLPEEKSQGYFPFGKTCASIDTPQYIEDHPDYWL